MKNGPDLPPIGSLWQHRTTGERRFLYAWWGVPHQAFGYIAVERVGNALRSTQVTVPFADWLAWQADADRIDTAREGKETT